MKLIWEEWKKYRAQAIHPAAPEVQIIECKRAFYAGFQTMLSMGNKLSDGDGVTANDEAVMRGIHEELKEFAKHPF